MVKPKRKQRFSEYPKIFQKRVGTNRYFIDVSSRETEVFSFFRF